ncbi:hypothetical protein EV646_108168 [Kribbella antiqua]|uniref:TIGR04255 family protein n=1 Tax=Kribbella antiqua TaxID=2512217 RepID=A0A4R2IRW3_9ACTN|nr:hypothetical protein [Kribbella antiqua]TCO45545.1 hypothetical protein EV646_108168 [Kribbella antiqua]
MSTVPLSHDELALVVKGHFNPAIFSPAWLSKVELIGPGEYEDSEVQVISPAVAKFQCGWLECTVTQDTLQLSTTEEAEFERTRDAAAGVLRILDQTPIAALGINRFVHFPAGSLEQWHSIGDTLVPKDNWSGVLTLPGLLNLTLYGVRPDRYAGKVQVIVEPSESVQYGVKVTHNDHYDLRLVESQPVDRESAARMNYEGTGVPSSDRIPLALEILRDDFQSAIKRSNQMVNHLFKVGGIS